MTSLSHDIIEYREDQYVNGVFIKSNHALNTEKYRSLEVDFYDSFDTRGCIPSTLSKNSEGKLTGYISASENLLELLRRDFKIPFGDWWGYCALNVTCEGLRTVKMYDKEMGKYLLPKLPDGADLDSPYIARVATTYVEEAGFDPTKNYEVYFKADRSSMVEYTRELGFSVQDEDPDYWGVVFNSAGEVVSVKALIWRLKVGGFDEFRV